MAKDEFIRVRVSGEQHAVLVAAANQVGLDVSSWLRMVGLREAGSPAHEVARVLVESLVPRKPPDHKSLGQRKWAPGLQGGPAVKMSGPAAKPGRGK